LPTTERVLGTLARAVRSRRSVLLKASEVDDDLPKSGLLAR